MNPQIQQLAEQARASIPTGTLETEQWIEAYNEKLAELIVRECLSIVDDAERGGSNEVWDNAVEFIRRDLKEHFGVEE